jgi:hypothetical protein
MTLDAYLKRDGAETLTDLSAKLGITKGRLSQLRESTDWPPELALKAESETDGALNASDLSPVIADARRSAA